MNTLTSVLKVVIAHEDLNTCGEALAVLSRLAAQLESEFQIESDVWQMDRSIWDFEMLRDPELRKQAVTDAADADMIILSVCDSELPVSVQAWLESALLMKDGRPAALVALLAPAVAASGRPSRPEAALRRLAGKYGLDFFCSANGQSRHIASSIESIISRIGDDPSFADEAIPHAAGGREWGVTDREKQGMTN